MPDKFFTATTMPDSAWWQALWPDPSCVLRKLCFKPGMSAIDLCCGDGHFTAPMATMLITAPMATMPSGDVYALDIDPEMLAKAKMRGAAGVRWIESDAAQISEHIEAPVDIVFIANTFHGVPDPTGMAKSVLPVLKPGGLFVVLNWHVAEREETPVLGQPRGPRKELRMPPVAVAQAVEPAGFELIEVVQIPPYHYGAIFQKPRTAN
ncbi:MAG: class I SAM-dependent methyltransferase [Rhodobacteraceae bacterium]|nr:class I SAM-dependent methyltransferase [Paracoccaceae bacterium]